MSKVIAGQFTEVHVFSALRNWTVAISLAFSGLYVCSVLFRRILDHSEAMARIATFRE